MESEVWPFSLKDPVTTVFRVRRIVPVYLYFGQTIIIEADFYRAYDARHPFNPSGVVPGGGGSVTSVGLTMPAPIFNVSGSPVTSAGTFVVTLGSEAANTALMGGTAGSAIPVFRPLVAADIPALSYVTNVGLSMPNIFNVANSPVTSIGTFAVTLGSEGPNTVFAGGTSGSAIPVFRQLVAADIPALSYASSVSGSAPIASSGGTAPIISLSGTVDSTHGGTGISNPTAHDLLVANGASAMNLLAPGSKGNVIASNGTDYANVAVGTDGYVLSANSNATDGVSYILNPVDMGGRLTTNSADPVNDGGSGTTLYYVPFVGNSVMVPVSGILTPVAIPDPSGTPLSIDCSALLVGNDYDVFIHWTGSALALETLVWNAPKTGTISSIGTGTNRVITLTGSHSIPVDAIIRVNGNAQSANNAVWRVKAVASTTITIENLDATAPTTLGSTGANGTVTELDQQLTRATSLTFTAGLWYKTGDATRVYIGGFRFGDEFSNVANIYNSGPHRNLFNAYNQLRFSFWINQDPTASWSATGASWAPMRNYLFNRCECHLGVLTNAPSLKATAQIAVGSATNAAAANGIALNTQTQASGMRTEVANNNVTSESTVGVSVAAYEELPTAVGFQFFQWVIYVRTGTVTVDNSNLTESLIIEYGNIIL